MEIYKKIKILRNKIEEVKTNICQLVSIGDSYQLHLKIGEIKNYISYGSEQPKDWTDYIIDVTENFTKRIDAYKIAKTLKDEIVQEWRELAHEVLDHGERSFYPNINYMLLERELYIPDIVNSSISWEIEQDEGRIDFKTFKNLKDFCTKIKLKVDVYDIIDEGTAICMFHQGRLSKIDINFIRKLISMSIPEGILLCTPYFEICD